MGPRSCGDRVAIWEDDDDDVAERRASEPVVAGPLVQPYERIEPVLVLTGSRDPGIEAPLGGRRDNREVDDGWTWKSPTGSESDLVLERVRSIRRIRTPRGGPRRE